MLHYFKSEVVWCLFFGSLLATAFLTPAVMRLANWLGAVDRGGYRKAYRGDVPLLGGVAIATPFLVFCVLVAVVQALWLAHPAWFSSFRAPWFQPLISLGDFRGRFVGLATAGMGIVLLGMVDDIYGLRARVKFVAQILLALYLCRAGFRMFNVGLPLVGMVSFGSVLGTVVTVLWIVGLTNAFNIIDGMDGLSAGIALISVLAFSVLAAMMDMPHVVLLSALLAGSLLAFLGYNFPPAKVFLGDTGSMFLGFTLAAVSLLGRHKAQAAVLVLTPMFVLGLPILEAAITMLRRFLRGRPMFAADAFHTHHRLFRKGYSGVRSLFFLYAVAVLLAIGGILNYRFPSDSKLALLPFVIYGFVVIGVAQAAGYFAGVKALVARIARRRDNSMLGTLTRYAVAALSTNNGMEYADDIFRLIRRQARLRFVEAWFETGPVLIGSSGVPEADTADIPQLDTVERLRIKDPNGRSVIVRFQFRHQPAEIELEDVSACLASIFEQASIKQRADESVAAKREILGVGCNLLDYSKVLETIKSWREDGTPGRYVIAINPHSVMMSRRNLGIRQAMAGAALAVPDGIGMIWAANLLGFSHRGRVTGPTLMLNLCDWGRQHRFRHFFYGGEPGVVEELARRLSAEYPGLQVAGTCSPPFRAMSEAEDSGVVAMINAANPDIVWVGLGAPKQEQWMSTHKGRIKAPVMIGVGAAFDFHSGHVKWAPTCIRSLGLEWAYRLALEPGRMWRRNLDSPLFLFNVVLQRMKPPKFRQRTRPPQPETMVPASPLPAGKASDPKPLGLGL